MKSQHLRGGRGGNGNFREGSLREAFPRCPTPRATLPPPPPPGMVNQTKVTDPMQGRNERCHICSTVKSARRKFASCCECPIIVCKPCVENTGAYWNAVSESADWVCQKCVGFCPCKNCFSANAAIIPEPRKRTRSGTSPSRDPQQDSSSESSPQAPVVNERALSPLVSLASTSSEPSSEPPTKVQKTSSSQDLPAGEEESPPAVTKEEGIINEHVRLLLQKKQQCQDYLSRTQKLLSLIEKEQDRIERDLSRISDPIPLLSQD